MLTESSTIKDLYFNWLCDMANVNLGGLSFRLLFKELHRKKFLWSVPNDDNRAYEGMSLREKFCEEEGIELSALSSSKQDDVRSLLKATDVSMLELIFALAIRCHWMLMDGPNNLNISGWFWKILSNVGLDKFDDESFEEYGGATKIDLILNRVIERTYDRLGNGGLFPLKKSKKDQRKVEIWYQMCQFLVENYYVEDLAM